MRVRLRVQYEVSFSTLLNESLQYAPDRTSLVTHHMMVRACRTLTLIRVLTLTLKSDPQTHHMRVHTACTPHAHCMHTVAHCVRLSRRRAGAHAVAGAARRAAGARRGVRRRRALPACGARAAMARGGAARDARAQVLLRV